MKRLIKLAAIVIVFVLGLAGSFLRQRPTMLPYCEVARNGEQYHNKNVRVRATLFLGSDSAFIYEDCDPGEALASLVDVSGANEIDTDGEANQLLVPAQDSLKKVDAIVEGRFNAEFSRGCYGPKFHILASKVELLSPVSDATSPWFNEEGLRLKH